MHLSSKICRQVVRSDSTKRIESQNLVTHQRQDLKSIRSGVNIPTRRDFFIKDPRTPFYNLKATVRNVVLLSVYQRGKYDEKLTPMCTMTPACQRSHHQGRGGHSWLHQIGLDVCVPFGPSRSRSASRGELQSPLEIHRDVVGSSTTSTGEAGPLVQSDLNSHHVKFLHSIATLPNDLPAQPSPLE